MASEVVSKTSPVTTKQPLEERILASWKGKLLEIKLMTGGTLEGELLGADKYNYLIKVGSGQGRIHWLAKHAVAYLSPLG